MSTLRNFAIWQITHPLPFSVGFHYIKIQNSKTHNSSLRINYPHENCFKLFLPWVNYKHFAQKSISDYVCTHTFIFGCLWKYIEMLFGQEKDVNRFTATTLRKPQWLTWHLAQCYWAACQNPGWLDELNDTGAKRSVLSQARLTDQSIITATDGRGTA